MIITFQAKNFSCKSMKTKPSYIKVGDFITYHGELMQVVTVQKECPYLENLNRCFIQFTLITRDGRIVPTRNLHSSSTPSGYLSLFRPQFVTQKVS